MFNGSLRGNKAAPVRLIKKVLKKYCGKQLEIFMVDEYLTSQICNRYKSRNVDNIVTERSKRRKERRILSKIKMTSPLEETKGGGGAIPFDEPIENDPFSQLQQQTQQTQQQTEQQKQEEKKAKEIADASILFGENAGGATDFFLQQQSNTNASPSPFDQTSQSFFDHLGRASSVKSQEYVSQQPTSLVQAYDPSAAYTQYSHEPQQQSTTDYYSQYDQGQQQQQQQQQYDPQQYSQAGQEQQFDPNVHYYYDEQNQIHYYDPNTNLEYDMSQYDYNYQYDPQYSEYYQANYDPNAYATTAGVISESNAQAAYDPNVYSSTAENSAQATYDPNAYTTTEESNAQAMYDLNAYNVTEENNAQATYDPNAYTITAGATGENNAQAAYDPNAYAMTDKDSAQVPHYDPTATLEATHHAAFDSFDSTAYAPVQESYDPNAYTTGSETVPVHGTQSSQQNNSAVEGSEANAETIVSGDEKQKTQEYFTGNQDAYRPDMYSAAAYGQQSDVTFDFLQQDNTPSQNVVQHVPSSNQESKPAVYDISNDKTSHTVSTGDNTTTFDQHQYEGKGYNQDMYSSTFASDFSNAVVPEQYDSHQQEQQQQGMASPQVEGNIPTEVEYFNYQDQPYSSNDDIVKPHADASNSIQQELGADTSTTQVELNPSPDNTKDTDSQFAEVQLAPMNDTAAVIAATTETSQPDLFAYTPTEGKVQLTEYTPQSMDQSNVHEPVTKNNEGSDQQFEEVQLVANLYTPTETRTVPPHSLPSQPVPPQSYTESQAPPITSFERAISPVSTSYIPYRPSMDYASPRSSLDHRSSLSEARVASPAIPLVPCPDPQCEGENKPKAKFCCECGRPLAGLSRSNTPFSRSTTPFATFPQNTVENSPQQPVAVPRNPLDDKKDEIAKSLRQFYEQAALLDTALSNEEKKNRVLSYMDSRINEFPKEDSKHLLWKIIKLLVEENGVLGESEQLDKSVLSLFGSAKEVTDGATLLDKLEVFLLEGDREGACQFAMENDMWAHALMISQSETFTNVQPLNLSTEHCSLHPFN
ncbi:hypothetical protein RMATCC62417_17336 [Rhizopus microsporus]|nr:hypothetical protein RMATCC62417_17336 [Rhizopus microsporus]